MKHMKKLNNLGHEMWWVYVQGKPLDDLTCEIFHIFKTTNINIAPQALPENKGENTSYLILCGQRHPDTKPNIEIIIYNLRSMNIDTWH